MKKLTAEQLKKSIASGEIAPVYLFSGDDLFRKQEITKQIISTLKTDEFNLTQEDCQQTKDIGEVLTLANTMPAFADKRVIVLNNIDKLTKNPLAALINYLQNPLNTTCLVLFHNDYKKFKKNRALTSALSEDSAEVLFDELKGASLQKWLKENFASKGLKINSDTLFMLEELVGADLTALTMEIEKLSLLLAKREDKTVTEEDLLSSIGYSKEENPFALNNAVLSLNKKEALKIIDNLLKAGEEPIAILNKISNPAMKLFRIKRLAEAGVPAFQITSQAGLLPWESRLVSVARNLPPSSVMLRAIDKIIEADLAFKTSSADNAGVVLKGLILSLLPN
ncbi:MAG: DNA polymerase III subunit delta [Elusimicrobiaceae bacterium]|nr:DNA polymerase III subunit delta [Elusimicrobiaceae bacterium]